MTAKEMHANRPIMNVNGSIVLSRKDRKGNARKEADYKHIGTYRC
jgi:hypothetical protein